MAATDYDLPKNQANFAALSPLSFLARSEAVHPNRIATIHGTRRITWAEAGQRCRRLASALTKRGIGKGDTVAAMLPNIPEMWEAHFGIPMAGAVLNALNIRLDAATIAFILQHGEAKILLTDREFSATIEAALAQIPEANRPLVIDVIDDLAPPGKTLGETDYETFLTSGDPDFPIELPADEWDAIALNYTSGTTGNPKGVVYHHRGAYLNATSNVLTWGMPPHPVYLWTLPMFHCNGWCFPWTMAAVAGTNVCLRRVEPQAVLGAITDHGVTHMCGAPIIANMLIHVPDAQFPPLPRTVEFMAAGAPPPRRRHRRHRGTRLPHHPRLRPHRGLRPRHRLRLAGRMERPPHARTGPHQGPPGRALPLARRPDDRGRPHAEPHAERRHHHGRGLHAR